VTVAVQKSFLFLTSALAPMHSRKLFYQTRY